MNVSAPKKDYNLHKQVFDGIETLLGFTFWLPQYSFRDVVAWCYSFANHAVSGVSDAQVMLVFCKHKVGLDDETFGYASSRGSGLL